ncbi:helix-turn-helix domain-containing protein [Paenibacillus harenae]|uniref:helix-turn-helix domain-containing protein n=1 Tax=Paenibacillus harenae TaxID=306543 RepID=UPI00055C0ECD|nr:AraC family transcriptional regulator [Paenibacillus harenae]
MTETALTSLPRIHCVGDLWVQSGYMLGPRTINDFELVYFPEGTNTKYTAGNVSFVLKEPCILLTRPEEVHSYHFDPGKNVRHLFVHFEFAEMRNEEPWYRGLLEGGPVFPINQAPLVSGFMKKLFWTANHQPLHWHRRLSVLTLTILEELASSGVYSPNAAESLPVPVQQAIDYMAGRLAETISIEEVAARSGWSHEHFTRLFTSSVGMTPKRFLLELRLRRAEDWMLRGEGTIKQIAYQVGFKDEHHFSKMYKKIRGITASEYIKRCSTPLYRHAVEPLGTAPDAHYSANRLVLVQDSHIK